METRYSGESQDSLASSFDLHASDSNFAKSFDGPSSPNVPSKCLLTRRRASLDTVGESLCEIPCKRRLSLGAASFTKPFKRRNSSLEEDSLIFSLLKKLSLTSYSSKNRRNSSTCSEDLDQSPYHRRSSFGAESLVEFDSAEEDESEL